MYQPDVAAMRAERDLHRHEHREEGMPAHAAPAPVEEEELPPLPPLSDPPAPELINGLAAQDAYQVIATLHSSVADKGVAFTSAALAEDPALASTLLRVLHEAGRLVNPAHTALAPAAGFSALHDGDDAAPAEEDPRLRTKVCLPGDVDSAQLSAVASHATAMALSRRKADLVQEGIHFQETRESNPAARPPQDPESVTVSDAAERSGLFLARPTVPAPPLPPGCRSWLATDGQQTSHLAAHQVPGRPMGGPGMMRGPGGAFVKSEVKAEPGHRGW